MSIVRFGLAFFALLLALPAAGEAVVHLADRVPSALQESLERALRQGDRGTAVAALQQALSRKGFDPGPVDGVYGPLTEAAVKQAQNAWGLPVDGLAGRQTVGALFAGGDARPDQALVVRAVSLASGAVWPAQLAQERKPFALTFNGAPDPKLLPALLDVLRHHGARATFFVPGEAAEQTPPLLKQMAGDGHEIGNAGYVSLDMTRLSPSMMRFQLARAQSAIARASGAVPRYFRPPLGHFDGHLEDAAAMERLEMVLWNNLAAGDRSGLTPDRLVQLLAGSVYEGSVVMLHQDRPQTPGLVDRLLQEADRRGFRSVILSDLCTTCRPDLPVKSRKGYLPSQRVE